LKLKCYEQTTVHRPEVFTRENIQVEVLWVVTSCSVAVGYRRFWVLQAWGLCKGLITSHRKKIVRYEMLHRSAGNRPFWTR